MPASCAPQRRTIRRTSASTPTSSRAGHSAAAITLRSPESASTPESTSPSQRGGRSLAAASAPQRSSLPCTPAGNSEGFRQSNSVAANSATPLGDTPAYVATRTGIEETAHMTTSPNRRERPGSRAWADEAVRRIEADANRSADTHLHPFPLPEDWGVDLYLKDESVHPTGSLKHRLARSLFLYGLVNGQIGPGTVLVEASSGSTAVSEAYFARVLGLRFVTVVPRKTSPEKISLIEFYGGECHFVDHGA